MGAHHSDTLCIVNSEPLHHMRSLLLCNEHMRVIAEIRRLRLGQLKDELGLAWAELSRRIGRSSRDSTLSQIWHRAPDSKTGRPRQMGDDQARLLEKTFSKPTGWMDRDPEFDEMERKLQVIAQEPPPHYGSWPFPGISPAHFYERLTPEQRGEAIGFVKGLLSAAAGDSVSSKPSTAHHGAPQSTRSETQVEAPQKGEPRPKLA